MIFSLMLLADFKSKGVCVNNTNARPKKKPRMKVIEVAGIKRRRV